MQLRKPPKPWLTPERKQRLAVRRYGLRLPQVVTPANLNIAADAIINPGQEDMTHG